MKCVILQPSYIPWRGVFHQMQKADLFVFYDDVLYDTRGWRNRNRIKGPNGPFWLTVPIHSRRIRSERRLIKEVKIHWERSWNTNHLASISNAYHRAPYFPRYKPLLEEIYGRRDQFIADFTIEVMLLLARELEIRDTRFLRSSTLRDEGAKTDRLLAILKAVGGTHYITGPSARSYIEEERFCEAGIELEYMDYEYPEYDQLYPPFEGQVSILDLLLMKGPDAPRFIWR